MYLYVYLYVFIVFGKMKIKKYTAPTLENGQLNSDLYVYNDENSIFGAFRFVFF